MSTMQLFYVRLFKSPLPSDGYLAILAQLARLSLEQLKALKSDLSWDPWQAE
ncbi:MAG TPA: hypothetical protein VIK64_18055 [Anaerolineales bacterium]